jgi:tetratricopeptide (TPR) repeat protein
MFSSLAHRIPGSGLVPELEFAIARTYENQDQWPEAAAQYDHWVTTFTNHALLPQAQYARAWANWRAGNEPQAFAQITNFLAHFQTNKELAPLAQWWLADYFRRQGDLVEAERNFKWCYQNTNWSATSDLAYQAKLMAGRCAVQRGDWKDAKEDYFRDLINDVNCPADLQAQAWYAFGCASMSLINSDSTNKAPDYAEAIAAFDRIPRLYPSNPIVVAALGEKACCLLQSAQTSQDLNSVSNAFQQVVDAPQADAKARSIAKVGLGVTIEKLGQQATGGDRIRLLLAARDQYLDVLNGTILRKGETPDSFWTKEAGLKASRLLADVLKERGQAIKALEQLQTLFPAFHLEDRIKVLKAQEQEAHQNR